MTVACREKDTMNGVTKRKARKEVDRCSELGHVTQEQEIIPITLYPKTGALRINNQNQNPLVGQRNKCRLGIFLRKMHGFPAGP